jgi:hypothetical protein
VTGVLELHRKVTALANVTEVALRDAARAVEQAAKDQGHTVVLGKRRRRVKLGAYTRFMHSGRVVVYGRPTGPWVWLNTGTRAHPIPKRKPTARRPRPMHGAGYPHPISRTQLHHPGRGGQGAWRKVVARARIEVPKAFVAAVRKAVR